VADQGGDGGGVLDGGCVFMSKRPVKYREAYQVSGEPVILDQEYCLGSFIVWGSDYVIRLGMNRKPLILLTRRS
jgi:hypothetical protein